MIGSILPKKTAAPAVILALPLMIYALMRLIGAWGIPEWLVSWYYRGLAHYYAVYIVSFMSMVVALFATAAFGTKTRLRTLFITLAFSAIAGFSLVSSLTLPGVFTPGGGTRTAPLETNLAFDWSSRLTLLGSAIFFGLASVRWSAHMENRLLALRRVLWSALIVTFILCSILILGFPDLLDSLAPVDVILGQAVAAVSIILLIWASRRSWMNFIEGNIQTERWLTFTMTLLAQAHVFFVLGSEDSVSWWLYQSLVLAALSIALNAILTAFEEMRNLRPARYFFALGSVLIVGLSLVTGELATRLFPIGVSRFYNVGLTLAQGGSAFLVLYFIVLHLDRLITERTLALQREQRLRNELSQLVIHDLKNPLMVIRGSIEMLEQELLGPLTEQQIHILSLVNQSSRNLLYTINDTLDVGRLESGTRALKTSKLDLSDLLVEAKNAVSTLIERNHQTLTLSIPAVFPAIRADKELFRRVLYNLLSSAVKYTPEGGEISVTADCDKSNFILQIFDNSSTPFLHTNDRVKTPNQENEVKYAQVKNFSLTFCEKVISAHGGTLTVNDVISGQLFEVTLPLNCHANGVNQQ